MATTIEPLPVEAPMVDTPALTISAVWFRYLSQAIVDRLQRSAYASKVLSQRDVGAAIPPTSLAVGTGGVVRVSWMIHITRAAFLGVGVLGTSSVQLTLAYTDQGTNLTQKGPAMTTNTVDTVASGVMLLR